jgi:hypothetical protein
MKILESGHKISYVKKEVLSIFYRQVKHACLAYRGVSRCLSRRRRRLEISNFFRSSAAAAKKALRQSATVAGKCQFFSLSAAVATENFSEFVENISSFQKIFA